MQLQEKYPKRWATISKSLPGRTENAVKIRFKSLTRNVKTESDKDQLRSQITKTTLEEQIQKVSDLSKIRKSKEKASITGKLYRFGSGLFSSLPSLKPNSYYSLKSLSLTPTDTNTPSVAPVLTPLSQNSTELTSPKPETNLGDMFLPIELEHSLNHADLYSFDKRLNLNDSSFRKKRRASTTTSTLKNANLSYIDIAQVPSASRLNLFSSVAHKMQPENSSHDISTFCEFKLPLNRDVFKGAERADLLQKHQAVNLSDRSIDMSECLNLLTSGLN